MIGFIKCHKVYIASFQNLCSVVEMFSTAVLASNEELSEEMQRSLVSAMKAAFDYFPNLDDVTPGNMFRIALSFQRFLSDQSFVKVFRYIAEKKLDRLLGQGGRSSLHRALPAKRPPTRVPASMGLQSYPAGPVPDRLSERIGCGMVRGHGHRPRCKLQHSRRSLPCRQGHADAGSRQSLLERSVPLDPRRLCGAAASSSQ